VSGELPLDAAMLEYHGAAQVEGKSSGQPSLDLQVKLDPQLRQRLEQRLAEHDRASGERERDLPLFVCEFPDTACRSGACSSQARQAARCGSEGNSGCCRHFSGTPVLGVNWKRACAANGRIVRTLTIL